MPLFEENFHLFNGHIEQVLSYSYKWTALKFVACKMMCKSLIHSSSWSLVLPPTPSLRYKC